MAILVLTRPEEASRRFLAAVEQAMGRRADHVLSPAIEIEPVPHVGISPGAKGIIVTSEHGARLARAAGAKAGMVAWCVGERTAEVARTEGFEAIPAGGNAETLIAAIVAANPAQPLVHVRGEQTTGDVATVLCKAGLETADLVVYRQRRREIAAELRGLLGGKAGLVVPLFSARSAETFLRQIPDPLPLRIVAISAAVADVAIACGARNVVVAERPDLEAMVLATCRRMAGA